MIFQGDRCLDMRSGNVYKPLDLKCRLKWLLHKRLVNVHGNGDKNILAIL